MTFVSETLEKEINKLLAISSEHQDLLSAELRRDGIDIKELIHTSKYCQIFSFSFLTEKLALKKHLTWDSDLVIKIPFKDGQQHMEKLIRKRDALRNKHGADC